MTKTINFIFLILTICFLSCKENKPTATITKSISTLDTNKKVVEYLVWWDKYLKKDSTWEPKTKLIEDIGEEALNSFVKEFRDSQKKK